MLGVSFFQDHGNFHAFDVAVFTLFQASTGDGWSDIVRELYVEPGRAGSSITNLLVTCYFISYMLIVSFILIQVVIAVLLDEFSKVSDAEDLERSSARLLSAGTNFSVRPNPFVALVQDLSLCRDEASQRHMIHQVFDAVASAAGKPTKHALVTFRELVQGLRALDMRPPALFSRHDWHEMVVLPGLCDNRQRLGRAGFTALVSNCLHSHLVSELSLALAAAQSGSQWNDQAVCSLLSAVKVLLLDAQIKARGQHHHGHTHHHGHAHHHKPHGHSHETPHAPSAGEAPSLAQQVAEMRAAVMQLSSDVSTSRQHERAARQELADTVGELARNMASVVSEVARLSSYHQLKPVAADETNGRLVSRTDRRHAPTCNRSIALHIVTHSTAEHSSGIVIILTARIQSGSTADRFRLCNARASRRQRCKPVGRRLVALGLVSLCTVVQWRRSLPLTSTRLPFQPRVPEQPACASGPGVDDGCRQSIDWGRQHGGRAE